MIAAITLLRAAEMRGIETDLRKMLMGQWRQKYFQCDGE
jgi:hypothetical protein